MLNSEEICCDNICISSHRTKGLCLIARQDFTPGDVISENPARQISSATAELDFRVAQYLFVDPGAYKHYGRRSLVMVCGPLSFLNHDDQPNCAISWRKSFNNLIFAQLDALKQIHRGSELTIQYTDADDYRQRGYF